jgi:alkylation response protein AidB-like acyl-CoA dehydrogenase
MTRRDQVSISGDDSGLPGDERAVVLERAQGLIPLLTERAPDAAAARQVPAETVAEYRAAGILRILQPRRFGGMQGRFSLFSRIVEELTYGNSWAMVCWPISGIRKPMRTTPNGQSEPVWR